MRSNRSGTVSVMVASYVSPRPVFWTTIAYRTRSAASTVRVDGVTFSPPTAAASAAVSRALVPLGADPPTVNPGAVFGAVNAIPPAERPVPFPPTAPLFTVTNGRTSSNRRRSSTLTVPWLVVSSFTRNWLVRNRSSANPWLPTRKVTSREMVVDRSWTSSKLP